MQYNFPDEMKPEVKVQYQQLCEQGKILYDKNCAKCHTKKKWGKEIIPDFTLQQLKGYELREANKNHKDNLPEEQISAEELGLIMLFLQYKQKNN